MTRKQAKNEDDNDRRHEAFVERNRKKFQKEFGSTIHYNYGIQDNPRLQVFNQVMQEQARKKVN